MRLAGAYRTARISVSREHFDGQELSKCWVEGTVAALDSEAVHDGVPVVGMDGHDRIAISGGPHPRENSHEMSPCTGRILRVRTSLFDGPRCGRSSHEITHEEERSLRESRELLHHLVRGNHVRLFTSTICIRAEPSDLRSPAGLACK